LQVLVGHVLLLATLAGTLPGTRPLSTILNRGYGKLLD